LLFTTALFAQNEGTISGTVYDIDGNPVANAPVQAKGANNRPLKVTSSKTGGYALSVLPGAYDVSVELLGFNPFTQKNVMVAAGQSLRLDIHLLDYQLNTLGDGRDFRVDLISPHKTPSGTTPRTKDGRPDFTGVWYAQRPVDGGKPEPLPWAEKLLQERIASNSKDAPGARCLTRGITAAGALFPYEIVQTPARLVMIFE